MTTIEKILYQIKIDKLITFSEILKFSDIFLNAKQGFISRTNHKYPALFMEIIEWQIIDHAISAAPEFEKESSLIPFFDAIEKLFIFNYFQSLKS